MPEVDDPLPFLSVYQRYMVLNQSSHIDEFCARELFLSAYQRYMVLNNLA